MSAQISVSEDVKKVVEKYAEKKGCSIGEAAERLVRTAVGRLNAVHKYAAAQAGEPVKKPAKKKASKVKGPIARKARKAPEAQATA